MIKTPPSLFWTQTKLDKPMMDYLWSQIALAKEDHKPDLVGHVSKSLVLPDTEDRLFNLVNQEAIQLDYLNYEGEYSKRSFWVNYQKKYEFNPVHNHYGNVSFVIWMKIPYEYEDEKKRQPASNVNGIALSGSFEFLFLNALGDIQRVYYNLSPEFEGEMLVFPARLYHQVYPFYTSDEERISIAGNLH